MKYDIVYAPVKVSERLPESEDEYFCIGNHPESKYPEKLKFIDKFRNGNIVGFVNRTIAHKDVEWLEKKESVYIFTKEELKELQDKYWQAGYDANTVLKNAIEERNK